MSGEKMRKLLLTTTALLIAASAATAQETELEPWACPEGFEGQTLNVYNWGFYIAEDTVANFQELCGVTVNYDVYISNEDLIARLLQGNPGYDIVIPTGYAVQVMIEEGLLTPLDPDAIPNIANISPDLLDQSFDPGNVYSVPYQWGTIGIAYNRTAVGEDITSYEQLFTYDGPVAWLEDVRGMLGIALNQLGFDPNSTDVDEIAAARDYLIENGENVLTIVMGNSKQLLQAGEIDMAIDYPGNTFQLLAECNCDDFAYVIPSEGTQFWMDNVAIPTDAPNEALANVFIDYLLDPQVSADISNYTAYGTPNAVALEAGLIDEALLNNPGIYPTEEVRARLFESVADPDNELEFNFAWDEVKVALGR
jgi:spermidine/putrescine transport system substrate-binding protein